ncbi:MAG: anaerobic carbon-monoxide dehydrogenase catalytic subunit [Bacillota bacterium]
MSEEDKARKPAPMRSVDPAALAVLEHAAQDGVLTAWDRYQAQQPQCGFGSQGICCRICTQGPCRLNFRKEAQSKGVCGATAYTIVARNVARMIGGGTACHSDHGRHVAHTLLAAAEGKTADYAVKDPAKLRAVARRIGLEVEGKDDKALAREVALAALEDFGRHDDTPLTWLMTTITEGRKAKFHNCDILPTAIDRAVVENMHRTAMGMDNDPVDIIFGGLKTALADFAGMHLSTDLSDILFGTPVPIVSEANLGVIDPAKVNIACHGHNPTLSEQVVAAARALDSEAKAAGATGINVVGICCTGNELLMRQGMPLATNAAAQELVILTGALDAMIADVQCIMPSVKTLSECFHTRIITTSPIAKIPGSYHFDFQEATAMETAKAMVRLAVEAFKLRQGRPARVPADKHKVIAGFSTEAMLKLLSGLNPDRPIRALNDAVLSGQLKGVCLFAGCNNAKLTHDLEHLTIARKLAAEDVFLLATGCAAGAFAKAGLMGPAAVDAYAGPGLKRFIKDMEAAAGTAHGLPLVFHMGSCVDNTRAADFCKEMADDLRVDVPKVPFVASAPENMHEKAVSIGSWCVAMGLPVHVGVNPYLEGSPLIMGIATQIAHDVYGGYFMFEPDPDKAAARLLDALKYRTWKLGVHHAAAAKFGTSLAAGY